MLRNAILAWMAMLVLTAPAPAGVQSPVPPPSPAPPVTPNGLAATPPMGWNSWNRFGCDVNEAVVRRAADAMVASGMKAAGYNYVVIDDCWHGVRDAHGDIQADPGRFPSGIKALADYVHAKGLRFGIYSDAGTHTCAGRPGSRGYEYQDAAQYAAWGVDYLKYDWCDTGTEDARAAYETMAAALRQTGRPIVFSLCEWGAAKPWFWAGKVGNLWRTTGDIYDGWEGYSGVRRGVLNILDLQVGLDIYAGPGHWNDPDMLEVGNGGMTADEYRAHFSLWAILAAPLMAGNDLAAMAPETRAILTNAEVIAVDQDPLGIEGRRLVKAGDAEVWARPLKGGGRAVVLLNRGREPRDITIDWQALGYPDGLRLRARDLWTGHDAGLVKARYTARVAGHAAVMLRLDGA